MIAKVRTLQVPVHEVDRGGGLPPVADVARCPPGGRLPRHDRSGRPPSAGWPHRAAWFVHDPVRLLIADERLEVIVGDVLDPPSVEEAVSGKVVRRKTDSESIVSEGVANTVPALERAGARRLVFLSIMGVREPAEPRLMRHVLPRMLKDAYIHRELAEETRDLVSRLEWVIVRAVRLFDSAATGRYRTGEDVRVGRVRQGLARRRRRIHRPTAGGRPPRQPGPLSRM